MRKMALTADAVFEYAKSFTERAVADGKSLALRYPKLKDVARRFRVRQSEIADLVDEGSSMGYLGIVVAFGGPGGYGVIREVGDRLVEAY